MALARAGILDRDFAFMAGRHRMGPLEAGARGRKGPPRASAVDFGPLVTLGGSRSGGYGDLASIEPKARPLSPRFY